jgi:hypothetical protein
VESGITFACASVRIEIRESRVLSEAVSAGSRNVEIGHFESVAVAWAGAWIEVGGGTRASMESSITFARASVSIEIWKRRVLSEAVSAGSGGVSAGHLKSVAIARAGALIEVGGGTRASVESSVTFARASVSIEIREGRVLSEAVSAGSRGVATGHLKSVAIAWAGALIEVRGGTRANVESRVALA